MKKALWSSTLLIAAAAHAQDSTFTLGAGIGAGTRYSGSDEYLVSPVIVADYQAAKRAHKAEWAKARRPS